MSDEHNQSTQADRQTYRAHDSCEAAQSESRRQAHGRETRDGVAALPPRQTRLLLALKVVATLAAPSRNQSKTKQEHFCERIEAANQPNDAVSCSPCGSVYGQELVVVDAPLCELHFRKPVPDLGDLIQLRNATS